jgi:hypothetical protein
LPARASLRTSYVPTYGRPTVPSRQFVETMADVTPEVGTAWAEEGASWMGGRAFLFVVADEILPSRKVIRRVLSIPARSQAEVIATNPELYGIKPSNPGGRVTLAEHALGNNASQYISASTKRMGAPNFDGRPVFIDVAKAERAGVVVHPTEEIIRDLDRFAAAHPSASIRVEKLKKVILETEGEVLLEGTVPGSAVKSFASVRVTQGLRFVQTVGVVFTVYDLGAATVRSFQHESAAPIIAESIRQGGGWAAGLLGAKLGASLGAAVGIETGPGALLTGAVGAVLFGAAGYLGFDWIADRIDRN